MDWERGRENKQHISGRVFLNPSLTSHQNGKNKEKRFILQSCKYMQKGNIVFETAFKKRNLTKRIETFLNKKRTQRQEICNFVWKSQRHRKQNNTHKEKKKEKQKKKRENSKKGKEQKTPTEKIKKWQRNQKQSKNKICKRYKKRWRQRKHKEKM